MVTYTDLFSFVIMLCAVITLLVIRIIYPVLENVKIYL